MGRNGGKGLFLGHFRYQIREDKDEGLALNHKEDTTRRGK